MSSQDYVRGLLVEMSAALEPVVDALEHPTALAELLSTLGWYVPADGLAHVPTALADVGAAVSTLRNHAAAGGTVTDLAGDLAEVVLALAAAGAGTGAGLPPPLGQAAFWRSLAADLVELLLYEHLRVRHPLTFGLLAACGVARLELCEPDAASGREAYDRRTLDVDGLPAVLSDPGGALATVFGWGRELRHGPVIHAVAALLAGVRADSVMTRPGTAVLDAYYDRSNPHRAAVWQVVASAPALASGSDAVAKAAVAVVPVPPDGDRLAAPTGLALVPVLTGAASGTFPLGKSARLTLSGTVTDQIHILLRPTGVRVRAASLPPDVELTARLDIQAVPAIVVAGDPAGSRLELHRAHLALTTTGPVDAPDVTVEAVLDKLCLVLSAGEGDTFMRYVLGPEPLSVDLPLGLAWSRETGLRLAGAKALDLELPLSLTVAGVVTLHRLYLHAGPDDGRLEVRIAVSGGLTLGPIAVVMEQVGLAIAVRGADAARPGNLGVVDLGFGFAAPRGIGLSVEAGPVKGGGYLFCDRDLGQYAGAVELVFGTLALKAVGLLSTKLPDGSAIPGVGWSLLVIISAEFPPIQLGYGFTLNGVGGLLGIYRAANLEGFRKGVRTGALDSVMFPPDPVANAPTVIATLRELVPAASGRFLFGPMARIGWGAPKPLLTLDVAVLLELPAPLRLIILGRLQVALPNRDSPVVRIRLDSVGILDLARGEVSLDATVYDSAVAGFALTGDMAMRLRWSDDPTFALSVGGFHPQFTPPVGFPTLRRMALSLSQQADLRLRLEGYVAVTAATVQFGARLELHANAGEFAVDGTVHFDTLVRFQPRFGFEAETGAAVAVRYGSQELCSVQLALWLAGTNPWHARGEVTVRIFGLRATGRFDKVWGGDVAPAPPPAVDVGELLRAALRDDRAWTAQLSARAGPVVSLRRITPPPGVLLAHPLGSVSFTQRVVPLDTPIDVYGAAVLVPGSGRVFRLRRAWYGDDAAHAAVDLDPAEFVATTEPFCVGDFVELADEQRLGGPAFVTRPAGVRFGSPTTQRDRSYDDRPMRLGYATVYGPDPLGVAGAGSAVPIQTEVATLPAARPVALTGEELRRVLPRGAAARRQRGRAGYHPSGAPRLEVTVAEQAYAVSGGIAGAGLGGRVPAPVGYPEAVVRARSERVGPLRARITPA